MTQPTHMNQALARCMVADAKAVCMHVQRALPRGAGSSMLLVKTCICAHVLMTSTPVRSRVHDSPCVSPWLLTLLPASPR